MTYKVRYSTRVLCLASVLAMPFLCTNIAYGQLTMSKFASTSTYPIGVAASTTALYYSSYDCQHIYSVSPAGVSTPFATLPAPGTALNGITSCETYLALSPGLPGFPTGYLYATQGPYVYEVSPNGTVTLFATLPTHFGGSPINSDPKNFDNVHTSITFDTVGTFGGGLIITTSNGYLGENLVTTIGAGTAVYEINSTGTPKKLSLSGTHTSGGNSTTQYEGPAVAPLSNPNYPGALFVAAEYDNVVYVINSTGSIIGSIQAIGAEAVHFIPDSTSTNNGSCDNTMMQGWNMVNNWMSWQAFWGWWSWLSGGKCGTPCFLCSYSNTGYEYFQAEINSQALGGLTPAQLAKYAGSAIVPGEQAPTQTTNNGPITLISFGEGGPTTQTFVDPIATGPNYHEGGAMVVCPRKCQCNCDNCQKGDHEHCQNTKCQDEQCKEQNCQQQCQCQCWNCQHGDHQHCTNTQCKDQQCKQQKCQEQQCQCQCWNCQHGDHQHCTNWQCKDVNCH